MTRMEYLEYRKIGVLENWNPGVMENWNNGKMQKEVSL